MVTKMTRRRLGLGLAFSLIALPVVVVGGPSHAEASFTSRAAAQSFHVTITNDKGSIPTLPQIDGGIGSAQVSFSSFGGGVARAASPDAGSAASVPALVGALVPTLIPQPLPFAIPSIEIPGDITVQSGQQPAKFGAGPYALGASVTDTSADAKATLGGSVDDNSGAVRAVSTAGISVGEDGSVTARASSVVDGLKFNGLLSVGEVRSEVEVVRAPDGTLSRKASTEVGLIKVAGLTFAFRDNEFITPLGPLPVSLSVVTKLINNATQGLFELEVVAARKTENGMASSSLRLVQTVPPPPQCVSIPLPTPVVSGVSYCGTTTVVYDLGRSIASTDYSVIPEAPVAPEGVAPPSAVPEVPPGVSSGDLPLAVPPLEPGTAPTVGPELTPRAEDPYGLLAVSARFTNVANLYLAVAGFAVLFLLSSTCIRLLGVRNKWT